MRVETEAGTGGLKPYVLVRARLEALVSRALFYDLVAKGTVEGDGSACGRRESSGRCSAPMKFSEAEIRERAVSGLLHEVPLKHERSDDDLNPAVPMIPVGVSHSRRRCWCRSSCASRR